MFGKDKNTKHAPDKGADFRRKTKENYGFPYSIGT
jgi:hypothetical protein